VKLSFTTLGCPEWSLQTIVRNAADMGFEGIEIRGILNDLDVTKIPEFTEKLDSTRKLLTDHNLKIVSLSTSARLAVVELKSRDQHFEEIHRNISLARQLDAGFIRVFGGEIPEGYTVNSIMPFLVRNLKEIGDEAEENGVTIALETHDSWTDTKILAEVMEEVNHPNIRILWDLHHPYRFNDESIEFTYKNLRPYVKGVHIKDSRLKSNGEYEYTLLGEGDVPIKEMLKMLHLGGYDGYYTLEWEKRWHPTIPEPEEAFPQYVEKMREWLETF
jgi:sugar phosphate isomerase/epimerase